MNLRQLFTYLGLQIFSPDKLLRKKYQSFQELLRYDKQSLELISELEEIQQASVPVDWARVERLVRALSFSVSNLIKSLAAMHPAAYLAVEKRLHILEAALKEACTVPEGDARPPYTLRLTEAAAVPALVGGKALALSRVRLETDLPVPEGFVITTRGFSLFLEHNKLRHRLDEFLAEVRLEEGWRLEELCREMTAMITEAELPAEVAEEIAGRLASYQERGISGPWSVRSSAVSEDGEISFAGQYDSVLPVDNAGVGAAYKKVLASKYAPRAVAYRIRCGLSDQETPMAVLVLAMIDARVSGVVYTKAPEPPSGGADLLAVYAVNGLGERLVNGSTIPEIQYLTREPEPRLVGTVASFMCRLDSEDHLCLSQDFAEVLAAWGLRLEKLFGRPQDIEWCQDHQGAGYILQSRALHFPTPEPEPASDDAGTLSPEATVILEGGVTASAGWGVGQVWVSGSRDDFRQVPEDAVLVLPTLPPALVSIIGRLRAVVSEAGSQASHFASVAREFELPVLACVPEATKRLSPGQLVTVAANKRRVYLGDLKGVPRPPVTPFLSQEAPFLCRLHKLMKLVSPLHLIDPTAANFVPQECRSVHDLVRYAHEKGMAEMFSLVGRSGRGLSGARQLSSDLPISMYVLDLDGGISPEARSSKTVAPQDIISRPLRACWEGLTHPEVFWHKGLKFLDWQELDRISAGIMSLKSAALASYAVISGEYLHLLLRFGYHFAVIDALCGDNPEANYIAFRFKGGGGDYQNRLLRVQLLQAMLEWAGFAVKSRGDLLDARFERHGADKILARLTILGFLQGKTQLLDMALTTAEQVNQLAASFRASLVQYVTG